MPRLLLGTREKLSAARNRSAAVLAQPHGYNMQFSHWEGTRTRMEQHAIAHLAHRSLRSVAQDRCHSRSSVPAPASRQCPPHLVFPATVLRPSHQHGRSVRPGFLSLFCTGERLRKNTTERGAGVVSDIPNSSDHQKMCPSIQPWACVLVMQPRYSMLCNISLCSARLSFRERQQQYDEETPSAPISAPARGCWSSPLSYPGTS